MEELKHLEKNWLISINNLAKDDAPPNSLIDSTTSP
jgi:hypothetical protein